ncbi:MAG: TfoX/Sxy family protein [Betaproteobacteria bacterium]|nr:TfoX/Sxy family protein [Betaproteobacteria bacterium]
MAHDEQLASRIRSALKNVDGVTEKRMFGGVAFFVHGNMAAGVHKDCLIVRISPEDGAAALSEPGARPMDITGKPMKGWLMIDPAAIVSAPALKKWVLRGARFAQTLPAK